MKTFLNIISTTLIVSILLSVGYMSFEPKAVFAVTDEVVITLNVTAGISITSPDNTPMSTSLGVSTNAAIATTTWNVKTNNNAGYTLTVQANSTPAMQQTASVVVPDFQATPATWTLTSAPAFSPTASAAFGFSAYGTDAVSGTFGTATNCGATSTPSATLNYRGFNGTTPIQVATRSSTTTTAGVDTNVCYVVEQRGVYIASGAYTATITATATTL